MGGAKGQSYLKNAVILTATGLLLRFAGMFFRVWVAGRIGPEGMGLYQLIFTLYTLSVNLATAGISVTATRLVAEELSANRPGGALGVLRRVLALSFGLGCAAAGLQALLAAPAARYWLGDARAARSLRLLAPSLPFMAMAAALRGYFLARRRVEPNAVSQMFEQAVRICVVMALLPAAAGRGIEAACAAVVVGNTVSETLSCLGMFWFYRRDRRAAYPAARPALPRGAMGRLWAILLPVEGSRCMASALQTAENMLVPACLLPFLASREQAVAQYGALKGMAMPVLFFPFSFLSALATLLMPEITEAHIQGRARALERLIGRMLRLTCIGSILMAGLFTLYGPALGRLLYGSEEVGRYLRVLGPAMPFMYLESMVDGVLKGMGEQLATFRYAMWDSVLRIAGVLALLPRFGMAGFLAVMLASNAFTCILNTRRMLRAAGMRGHWLRWAAGPCLALAVALFLGHTAALRLAAGRGDLALLVCGAAGTGLAYLLLLWPFGLGDELRGLLAGRKEAGRAQKA